MEMADKNEKKKGNHSKQSISVLKMWLSQHLQHPYPTDPEKEFLMAQTGLNKKQVSNWFTNARKRFLKSDQKRSRYASSAFGYSQAAALFHAGQPQSLLTMPPLKKLCVKELSPVLSAPAVGSPNAISDLSLYQTIVPQSVQPIKPTPNAAALAIANIISKYSFVGAPRVVYGSDQQPLGIFMPMNNGTPQSFGADLKHQTFQELCAEIKQPGSAVLLPKPATQGNSISRSSSLQNIAEAPTAVPKRRCIDEIYSFRMSSDTTAKPQSGSDASQSMVKPAPAAVNDFGLGQDLYHELSEALEQEQLSDFGLDGDLTSAIEAVSEGPAGGVDRDYSPLMW